MQPEARAEMERKKEFFEGLRSKDMPWKDIVKQYEIEYGKSMSQAALQMERKRVKDSLRVWTDIDVKALESAHEYYETRKFSIVAEKMQEFGAEENWSPKQCQKKWEEMSQDVQEAASNIALNLPAYLPEMPHRLHIPPKQALIVKACLSVPGPLTKQPNLRPYQPITTHGGRLLRGPQLTVPRDINGWFAELLSILNNLSITCSLAGLKDRQVYFLHFQGALDLLEARDLTSADRNQTIVAMRAFDRGLRDTREITSKDPKGAHRYSSGHQCRSRSVCDKQNRYLSAE